MVYLKKRIKFILLFARKYRIRFVLIFVCILLTTFIVSTYPYIFGLLVDKTFYDKDFNGFLRIALIYLSVYLFNQLLHFTLDIITAKVHVDFLFDIRSALFNKVIHFKAEDLNNLDSGDVIYTINSDVDQIMELIYADLFYGIGAIIEFVLYLFFSANISYLISSVFLLISLIIIILNFHFSLRLKLVYKKLRLISSQKSSWIFQMLKNIRELSVMAAVKRGINFALKKEVFAIRQSIHKTHYEVKSERVTAALQILGTIMLYSISSILIKNDMITIGGFVTCAYYYEKMSSVYSRINKKIIDLPQKIVSIDRIICVYEKESECEKKIQTFIEKGKIKFDKVNFAYEYGSNILNEVSFEINHGERIAIVGRNGEGKSTLINLLCGFYLPSSGYVTIDGKRVSENNSYLFRNNISILNQNAMIFNETLRFNLIFSNDKTRDTDIFEVLKRVSLDEYVKELPKGLDTFIDEHFFSMSGGQKQRVLIARTILKDNPILIFDEATSSLDEMTELKIINSCFNIIKDKTIIMITHRINSILSADRILCIDNGHIVGFSSHKNLIKTCKTYQDLFKSQSSIGEKYEQD